MQIRQLGDAVAEVRKPFYLEPKLPLEATAGDWIDAPVAIVNGTAGRIEVKLGAEVSYEAIVHDTLFDNYGVFAFNASKTGNAYADFLLGLPSTMTQDAPVRKTDNGWYLSLFAQDDWRIHPRLTLNLGLRYDLQFPLTDPEDRKLAYVPGQRSQVSPTAPEGLLFPGDPGIPRGIAQTDYNNMQHMNDGGASSQEPAVAGLDDQAVG